MITRVVSNCRVTFSAMETKRAQTLFRKYAPAMAYITVRLPSGDQSIGSAFHLGDGVFVTARHVVENNEILQVRPSEPLALPTADVLPERAAEYDEAMRERIGFSPLWKRYQEPLSIAKGPYFHEDPRIDVAAFSVAVIHPKTPVVQLGSHLDDWIHDHDWILSEAILLGYPPIPLTSGPHLVAARAEINSIVVPHNAPKVHFIVSAIPRGGFSGGLALSEHDFVLGLVTHSLCRAGSSEELGFFAVLSIEAIFQCLGSNNLLPPVQRGKWTDFWNTKSIHFVEPDTGKGRQRQVAYIQVCDDANQQYIQIWADDMHLRTTAVAQAKAALKEHIATEETHKNSRIRITLKRNDAPTNLLPQAACAAAKVFSGAGLIDLGQPAAERPIML